MAPRAIACPGGSESKSIFHLRRLSDKLLSVGFKTLRSPPEGLLSRLSVGSSSGNSPSLVAEWGLNAVVGAKGGDYRIGEVADEIS